MSYMLKFQNQMFGAKLSWIYKMRQNSHIAWLGTKWGHQFSPSKELGRKWNQFHLLSGEKSGAAGFSITGAVWQDIIWAKNIFALFANYHIWRQYFCIYFQASVSRKTTFVNKNKAHQISPTPGLSIAPGVAGGIWSRCWYSSWASFCL